MGDVSREEMGTDAPLLVVELGLLLLEAGGLALHELVEGRELLPAGRGRAAWERVGRGERVV